MSILIFEHSDSAGSERLGETLRDYGHRLNVLRLHDGDDVPPDLDNVDGIITCGGPQSAYDDSIAWLAPQMSLLRQARQIDMPIVGLCLGSQILARALGGVVEKLPGGIEFGWHQVTLNALGREDVIHTGIAWTSLQFQHHRDHVSKLPPGGRLLSSSARCKGQAWSHGLRTYGFQYHPEITIETIERWVQEEPEALQEAGITPDQLPQQTERFYPAFARLADRLFESIALFLMPVDRRYQGLVKDLHY
ncbi:MAG: type 1 glutamine amidotransferase [Phycisphaerales bacterium]|nr:type 1 glutamine amidotransferase [Phycisphaerales bacterium]MCI0631033.1 type 1 glutamine amidotransferase [Phycisphaerales bacterium]MCI0675735.1 type 1 glutamine amidotransferase [Phycisphaerales bacterium]